MSTKIQQPQVRGLVDAVASIDTVSGELATTGTNLALNLITTGLTLENAIIATGTPLDAADIVLSGNIVSNTDTIILSGSFLESGSIDVLTVDLASSGQVLRDEIQATGEAAFEYTELVAGHIVNTGYYIDQLDGLTTDTGYSVPQLREDLDTTSGVADDLTGNFDLTGKNLSGNLELTGSGNASRLGDNYKVASNLGSGIPLDGGGYDHGDQLYGETIMVPNSSGCSRILQFMVDCPKLGDCHSADGAPFDGQYFYLGGDVRSYPEGQSSLVNRAYMPRDSQWNVKLYATARSIEPSDWNSATTGVWALETGFILTNYSKPIEQCVKFPIMGVSGASGYFTDGDGVSLVDICCVGAWPQLGGGYSPQLQLFAYQKYDGVVRFHVTAYISQLTGLQFEPA